MGLLKKVRGAAGRRVRRVWRRLDAWAMPRAARSGRLSSWYYALFDRSFDREHRAVLQGRLAFEASRSGPASTSSLLRRNTHRLEKGLLSRPRRDVFALSYIDETVQFYEAVVSGGRETVLSGVVSPDELRWAHDVLAEYFEVTADHPQLRPLRRRFAALPAVASPAVASPVPVLVEVPGEPACEPALVPYRRDLSREPSVRYDDLLALAWRRRSVRWFKPEPVPRELIEKAMAVAALSPSACNRQPFVFRVFDDPALIPKVAALPGGTKGFHHQFPAIVAVVGELRNYYGERDRHLIYIDASLAAMSFVLAAETLGLGTCCINWPDIEVDEVRARRTLSLDPDQRPILFIAVGFPDPDGLVAYSQKKPVGQLCRFNFE